jgi:hypothetical protein
MVGAIPNGCLRVVDVAETRQTRILAKYRVRRRQQISCKLQFAGIATTPRPATRADKLSNPIAEREKRNATPFSLTPPLQPAIRPRRVINGYGQITR